MRRTKIVAFLVTLAMFLAIPAYAGQTYVYPPDHNCGSSKIAHLRFTVASGSPTVTGLAYRVGRSNWFPGGPTSDWFASGIGINVGPGQTYTRSTGANEVHDTTFTGATSWIRLSTPTGQQNPYFSWIGWVCI